MSFAKPSADPGDRLVGLRVDACTYEGFREGVPNLLSAFGRRGVKATLFPAMGPDRSGLAVLRVFTKKGFLKKMLTSGAAKMYGWRTALYGTLLPSPRIAERAGEILKRAAGEGHEVGVHSWDHVRWQDRLDELSDQVIREDYDLAISAYELAVGRRPSATAAPAWLVTSRSLGLEEKLGFSYASDTRGRCPFRPAVDGRVLELPQVPITLPTLDEVLGRDGFTAERFFERILSQLKPQALNVFTVHAEAEGRAYLKPFEEFLDRGAAAGWRFLPLKDLLSHASQPLPICPVERGLLPGRAGSVSIQGQEKP